MTVNEIMELVAEYARDIEDITSSEAVFAHVGKRRYTDRDKSFDALRTAIEELAADARRYCWFADVAVTGEFDRAEAAFARFDGVDECTKDELDAAIDAAMEPT